MDAVCWAAVFQLGLMEWERCFHCLTAFHFPIIFIATYKNNYKNADAFYGLMLLSQAGLMGVFLAMDALLFYFFWELALNTCLFSLFSSGAEKEEYLLLLNSSFTHLLVRC